MDMATITFRPSGKTVRAPLGVSLLQACAEAGITLSTPCAGKGFCGKCRVKILSGNVPVDEHQRGCLPARLLEEGWRASCIASVNGDLTLADPAADGADVVVLSDFQGRSPRDGNAFWEYENVMAAPSQEDQTDDLTRVLSELPPSVALAPHQPCLMPLLARLPGIMRRSSFRCRVIGMDEYVLDVQPLDDSLPGPLGLAVDIGTTTIAAALCDCRGGSILAVASRANPQSKWGDDVISRIECASRGRDVLLRMRESVVRAIEELTEEACRTASVAARPVIAVVAANTVMNHLFLGVPPGNLAVSPFVPVFRKRLAVSGAELGWLGETPPLFYLVPNISAYVGGDVTAGILAHDLRADDVVSLLLDVGTNGEIALSVRGTVYACSTAAGPAFEGARIGQGMRASPGAISRVAVNGVGDLDVGVIDSREPAGICGTGLLDAVAALRKTGMIDEYGRILNDDEIAEGEFAPGLTARVFGEGNERAVRLSPARGGGGGEVCLTQKDVREFQLAKGAVAAGVRVLAGVAGVELQDIEQVLLAGGFGNYLDPESAVVTGLLPGGIAAGAVRPVGNSSLAGARLCLLSPGDRREAESLAANVRYVELSGRGDFQRAFAEEMLFPE